MKQVWPHYRSDYKAVYHIHWRRKWLPNTFLGLPRDGFWFGTDFGGASLCTSSAATLVLRRSEILQHLQIQWTQRPNVNH